MTWLCPSNSKMIHWDRPGIGPGSDWIKAAIGACQQPKYMNNKCGEFASEERPLRGTSKASKCGESHAKLLKTVLI